MIFPRPTAPLSWLRACARLLFPAMPFAFIGPLLAQPLTLPTDSLAADSARLDSAFGQQRQVRPRTRLLSLQALNLGREQLDSLPLDPLFTHIWDPIDSLSGFAQSLGQIGKPLRAWNALLPVGRWQNPGTGSVLPHSLEWEPGLLEPGQVPLHESRTPYVEAQFAQSSRETQLLNLTLSQNIRPGWNTSLVYRRRTAQGAYNNVNNNNTTDHYSLGAGMYWRSSGLRYGGRLQWSWNQMQDKLNGGVAQDGSLERENSFDKFAQPTVFDLGQARYERRQQGLHTCHHWMALNDSSLKLGPFVQAQAVFWMRQYTDDLGTAPDSTATNPYPGLASLGTDSLNGRLNEQLAGWVWLGRAGLHLHINGAGWLWHSTGSWSRETHDWSLSDSLLAQPTWNLNHVQAETRLKVDRAAWTLNLHAHLKLTTSNLFAPAFWGHARAHLHWKSPTITLTDSSLVDTGAKRFRGTRHAAYRTSVQRIPFALSVQFLTGSLNPSLQEAFWQGQTFAGNPNLTNEQALNLQAEARWNGAPSLRRALLHLPNTAWLGAGWTLRTKPIFLDEQLRAQQPNAQLQGPQLQGGLRWRLWQFYAEARMQAQWPQGPQALHNLVRSQPNLWGEVHLFYRDNLFRGAAEVVLGLRLRGFTAYEGLRFDPSLQTWNTLAIRTDPIGNRIDPYAWADLYLSGRIDRATVFLKVQHLNEGLLAAGYWTTPYYPMLERSFSFGLTWRFFD